MAAPLRVPCSSSGVVLVLAILLTVPLSFAAPRQELPSSAVSVAELKARAQSGDVAARQQLSQFLLRGDAAARDYDLALSWLRDSAQNNPSAQFLLGYLYEQGHGVPRDYAKAAEFYQAAALLGHPTAQNNLASLFQRGAGVHRDLSKAVSLFLASAQQGLAAAQNNLGTLYFHGLGVTRDMPQAARWIRAAALQGNPSAQYNLGLLYLRGLGVNLDFTQAAHWITLSAQQNHSPAQTDLACLYEKGLGVPMDYVAAYAWYSRAIAGGDLAGKAHLKGLSHIMTRKQLEQAIVLASAPLPQPPAASIDPALPNLSLATNP